MTKRFEKSDGGRADAGFEDKAQGFGDCVVRAIAIATERGYQQVYDEVYGTGTASPVWYRTGDEDVPPQGLQLMLTSPDDGVANVITARVLSLDYGWVYNPSYGSFLLERLPLGRIIVRMCSALHHCAVVDRVIHDDCDEDDEPSQGGQATIDGYWTPPEPLRFPNTTERPK